MALEEAPSQLADEADHPQAEEVVLLPEPPAIPLPKGVPIAGRGRGKLVIVSADDEDCGEYSA